MFNHHVSYGLPIPSRLRGELPPSNPMVTRKIGWRPFGSTWWGVLIGAGLVLRAERPRRWADRKPRWSAVAHHPRLRRTPQPRETTAPCSPSRPLGNPSPLVNGLHASWNATDNALLGRLIGNRGSRSPWMNRRPTRPGTSRP